MITNLIHIGDKLDIRLFSEETDDLSDIGKHYTSVICELPDEENMVVTIPTEHGKLVLMPVDTRLTVVVYTKKGVYMCSARISERFRSGNIFMMNLELSSKLTKFQRRAYYRWDCLLNIDFRILPEDAMIAEVTETNLPYYMEECVDKTLYSGTILDVSGGGLRFRTNRPTPEKSVLLMSFILENETTMFQPILLGRLLHCDRIERTDLYEYRVEFQGISEADREIIIKFIFEEERKAKK